MPEDFLRRRKQLSNPTVVAEHIAQALLGRMGMTKQQAGSRSAIDLIVKIVRASRSRESD